MTSKADRYTSLPCVHVTPAVWHEQTNGVWGCCTSWSYDPNDRRYSAPLQQSVHAQRTHRERNQPVTIKLFDFDFISTSSFDQVYFMPVYHLWHTVCWQRFCTISTDAIQFPPLHPLQRTCTCNHTPQPTMHLYAAVSAGWSAAPTECTHGECAHSLNASRGRKILPEDSCPQVVLHLFHLIWRNERSTTPAKKQIQNYYLTF